MDKSSALSARELIKSKFEYITAICVAVFFVFASFSGIGLRIEYMLYDSFLAIKPEVPERDDILLVNIDDQAIEEIGAWPWTRDVLADAIIRLKEVGGKYVVFDIEYMTPGQSGVNRSYVKLEFPARYGEVHQEIQQYIEDYTTAVSTGAIPPAYAGEVGDELAEYVDWLMNELSLSITGNIFRDNDEYFARALRYFGKSFVTINSENINLSLEAEKLKKFARERYLFTNVSDPEGLIKKENEWTRRDSHFGNGIAPAIQILLESSRGAGFPNVFVDEDGVRRRIELLVEYEGAYVGQLVFTPILHILEPERIERQGRTLVLYNSRDPADLESGKRIDFEIPLDEHGRLLINWLKKNFTVPDRPDLSSFTAYSVYSLTLLDELEEKLIDNLGAIESLGIKTASGYLSYHDAVVWLRAAYADLLVWKNALLHAERDDFDDYFAARRDFFDNYGEFLDGGFDTEIYDTFDRIIAAGGDGSLASTQEQIRKNFDQYRTEYTFYKEQFGRVHKASEGKFCIVGYSGLGTTDLGVNPFWKQYANVGTHANIYNTIMGNQFIYPQPVWISWLAAFFFSLLCAVVFRKLKSLRTRLLYGLLSIFVVYASFAAIFAITRIYLHIFVPLASVLITFILVSILKFIFSEQEKSFLRKAFTMYLSSDVVNQIVDDPSLLKLGGEEKQITALFTDIKSFSTLSEQVTPEHLVELLNKYLTVMSDIVLDQKGTIDKYIGDAIVSFFGAPIDLPDHAVRACLAAVRMKQAEEKLNETLLASNETPMAIHTRIGINTGAMVVGNMGTDNKMNYTIMGNDVNLAARLEGVNKAYGTWILVSESTWNATNGMFLGRKLDRVRVVGIDTPVQLYNIMAVRSEAPGIMVNLADRFNFAIDAYRDRRFADALLLFNKCLELDSEDQATVIFLERVKKLVKDGVPADWTDVVNMTSK